MSSEVDALHNTIAEKLGFKCDRCMKPIFPGEEIHTRSVTVDLGTSEAHTERLCKECKESLNE